MTLEQRIRTDIERRIQAGEWLPGDKIPFEHELVQAYGCARATVSKALEALARAGMIERRRKAGSFVASPQVHAAVLDVPDLAELADGRGQAYRWHRLERRALAAEAIAARADIREPALLLAGTHFADEQPLGYEERLISLASVPEAAAESFESVSPGSFLLRHIPWTRARHRIRAVAASRKLARLLDIGSGSPCLELERWTWRGSVVVTHVVQTFPWDRYDLTADFEPQARA
jgi:GntR family histidine utilization transcriptional repressor